ncbi:hypothetical protein F0562_034362 [Nyssa sinensis]|uniref:Uncharacterized protein n=1 Tax=Nyssa sinensis TaxID=561372 RepID=A0A5J5AHX8_9ASTE|nr:hypothetical protein F0562_034362 [Nyssa sinensis]
MRRLRTSTVNTTKSKAYQMEEAQTVVSIVKSMKTWSVMVVSAGGGGGDGRGGKEWWIVLQNSIFAEYPNLELDSLPWNSSGLSRENGFHMKETGGKLRGVRWIS